MPVVDLAGVFGDTASSPTRLVVIRTGSRYVALAVDSVLGIHRLPAQAASELPSLLRDAAAGVVERIGTLDEELLLVLNTSSIISDEVWNSLTAEVH